MLIPSYLTAMCTKGYHVKSFQLSFMPDEEPERILDLLTAIVLYDHTCSYSMTVEICGYVILYDSYSIIQRVDTCLRRWAAFTRVGPCMSHSLSNASCAHANSMRWSDSKRPQVGSPWKGQVQVRYCSCDDRPFLVWPSPIPRTFQKTESK